MIRKTLLKKTEATYRGGWTMPAAHAGLQRARELRDKIASRYDEAISYTMPGRAGINAGPDQSQIYDDTAVIATPEFASRIQQGVIPNFAQWGGYVAGVLVEDGDEKDQLTRALETVDKFRFDIINSSNFGVEANECFLDLSIGTMALRIDEAAGDTPINCRAIPLGDLLFGIGTDGRPDPIYERRKLTLNALHVHYPDARVPADMFAGDNPDVEHEFFEAWHRDWSRPAEHHYRRTLFVPAKENAALLTEWYQGVGSCPMIVGRWSKASGEGWGRGPNFNILPSLRKVNFAERSLLDHTDMQLAGIWTLEDDGVVNASTVRLEPGTMLPVAMGSAGLKNVAPGGDFDVAQYQLEEARAVIRKSLYTEQLGNPNKTPMSATEVNQRMAELARAIGSPFSRIVLEFAMPAIQRIDYILKKKNLIKMPKVGGDTIKLQPASSLAQAHLFEAVEAMDRFAATIQARLGPEMTNVVIDGTAFATELGDALKVSKKIIRPPAKQAEILGVLTQMAAQQQGAAPGGGMGGPGEGAAA